MKTFIHDYSIPSEVEAKISEAFSKCQDPDVKQLIKETQLLLKRYLSQDNILELDDVEKGFVRRSDADDAIACAKDAYIDKAIALIEELGYTASVEDPARFLVDSYSRPGWCVDLVIYQVPTAEDLSNMCMRCGEDRPCNKKSIECWEKYKNWWNYDNHHD